MAMKRRILVIAGSDSSGGAGLEADQKAIAAYGCYAMTATTALTAQNTQGVFDVHITPTTFVKKQIDACIDDIGVDVVKTGMLASEETVIAVAAAFRRHNVQTSVVDPVMVATSGAQLLPQDAVKALREQLLPLSTILTPNIPEAKLLLSDAGQPVPEIATVDDLISVAKAVQALGPRYVLLKGGHLPLMRGKIVDASTAEKNVVTDVLYEEGETLTLETDYISSKNTHGTGCSLASAIASNLALGHDIPHAVRAAKYYVEAGIKTAPELGQGSGPINHFHSSYTLPFAPGRFIDYLLDRPDIRDLWHRHTHHPFVAGLADGTLSVECFKHFLVQDYLYLVQFARANALAGSKAENMDDIAASASIVSHIHTEMKLHLDYCRDFGLSKEDIESAEEDLACTAYTRYILDVGHTHSWFTHQLAFAPCLLGYHAIASRLLASPDTVKNAQGNKYYAWIENYTSEDYVAAVGKGRELYERHAVDLSPKALEVAVGVFKRSIQLEIAFWDMGLRGPSLQT